MSKFGDVVKSLWSRFWQWLKESGSIRRLLVFLVGSGAVLLSKKFGIDVSEAVQLRIIEAIMAYLALSNVKDIAVSRAQLKAAEKLDLSLAKSAIEKGPQP